MADMSTLLKILLAVILIALGAYLIISGVLQTSDAAGFSQPDCDWLCKLRNFVG